MKAVCDHGYFRFYFNGAKEQKLLEDIQKFILVRENDYFTYATIAKLPCFSFKGHPFGNLIASENYSGKKEDLFLKNKIVYSISSDALILKSINSIPFTDLAISNSAATSKYLIPANSLINNKNVASYEAYYNIHVGAFIYSRIEFYGNH